MRRLGQLYHYWLHEAPLLTKALTAATLSGIGDRIAQRIEATNTERNNDSKPDDNSLVSASTARTLRMVVWGGLFTAPIMHTWFHLIERALPGTGKLVVAKKVVADMVIVAPSMALGFFTVTKSLEGASVSDAFDFAKAKLQPTLSMSYRIWPLANVLVFTVVPFQYRTPFVNCVTLGWSTFLSGMANKKVNTAQERESLVN